MVPVVLLGWLTACGTSIRYSHQGEQYFESCHDLDQDPEATHQKRLRCWQAWTEHYGAHRTIEERNHAETRIQALEGNGDAPHEPGPQPPGNDRASLAPADAQEAPLEVPVTTPPEDHSPTMLPNPTHAPRACIGVCEANHADCKARCSMERGEPCRAACTSERRICSAGCP